MKILRNSKIPTFKYVFIIMDKYGLITHLKNSSIYNAADYIANQFKKKYSKYDQNIITVNNRHSYMNLQTKYNGSKIKWHIVGANLE